jgi:dolichol-phosphate mannosyltransferase
MNHRAVRRGLKIAEIPITFEERTIGKSKLSLGVQIESAVAPWRLRFGTGRRRSQNRS